MEQRRLGRTDLVVSCLGIGGNHFGKPPTMRRRREVEAALDAALDGGINFIDTAPVYGEGLSEEIIGATLGARRDKLVLCTKAGSVARSLGERLLSRPFTPRIRRRPEFSPIHIRRSVEGSLSRLRTDRLDLLLLHSPPACVREQEAVFAELEELQRNGAIRYYGVSPQGSLTTAEALAWLAVPGISVLQIVVNALVMLDLEALLPATRERGIGLIARQPFERGAVFRDRRILRMAAAHPSYSAAQFALRFVLQLEGLGPVLAGISRPEHVAANLAALTGPPLAMEQMERLRGLAAIR